MVDDRRNNCGDEGIAGLSLIPTSREEDMAAFDQLGPKTRATINFDLGVKWSSFMTLQYIRQIFRKEPKDRKADEKMAKLLKEENTKILQQLAVEDSKMADR